MALGAQIDIDGDLVAARLQGAEDVLLLNNGCLVRLAPMPAPASCHLLRRFTHVGSLLFSSLK